MGLKSLLAAFSLSVLCLAPHASFADTLSLVSTSGGSLDGVDLYPYQMTLTTPSGTDLSVNMSCLNYDREITFGETWAVTPYFVNSIPAAGIDGESQVAFLQDAWLFNQYTTAGSTTVAGIGSVTNSEIQFAIWDVMDSAVSGDSGFDSIASQLVSKAGVEAGLLPSSYYSNNVVFVPDTTNTAGWTDGQPQIFMANPVPPGVTPEPSSLMLLGTGLVGTVGLMRRKLAGATV